MAGAGYKLFNTGDVLTAAQVNTYLQEQTVMVFANAAARTTALASVLSEGMVSYLKDTNATEVYDGSAWVGIGNSGDITGVTAGTGITGGGTSGTVTITNSMATEITAAGDIIIGTGSGTFDNLPIGTTGQILTADTTVSPYKVKWATAAGSGALTKITTSSFSNVASVTIDSVFSSTYKTYLIAFDKVSAATGADDLQMQLRYGSTTQTTGYYGSSLKNQYNSSTFTNTGSVNASNFTIHDYTGTSAYPFTGIMWIQSVGTGSATAANYHGTGYENTNGTGVLYWGTSFERDYTGFLLKSSSSNITGNVVVYGLGQ